MASIPGLSNHGSGPLVLAAPELLPTFTLLLSNMTGLRDERDKAHMGLPLEREYTRPLRGGLLSETKQL